MVKVEDEVGVTPTQSGSSSCIWHCYIKAAAERFSRHEERLDISKVNNARRLYDYYISGGQAQVDVRGTTTLSFISRRVGVDQRIMGRNATLGGDRPTRRTTQLKLTRMIRNADCIRVHVSEAAESRRRAMHHRSTFRTRSACCRILWRCMWIACQQGLIHWQECLRICLAITVALSRKECICDNLTAGPPTRRDFESLTAMRPTQSRFETSALEPLFAFLSYARYVKSSHQNDPGRTILEILLVLFAIRTFLQSHTHADNDEKHFIQFSEKAHTDPRLMPQEVDELVEKWTPEPLGAPLTPEEQSGLVSVPVVPESRPKLANTGKQVLNLASYNFTGLASNEVIKVRAIETLRKYSFGSYGLPGFYGTIDVHLNLDRDIVEFLGTEASTLYSQEFLTIHYAISTFAKRGDIVADRVRWFGHNDLKNLEDVLLSVEKERRKLRGPLTRRFIVTEGIIEKDGRTGHGLTELYNDPATQIDMIIGSVANGLNSSGGFCAGSRIVVDHQHSNSTSFVFSAVVPALLAVYASEGINTLRNTPSIAITIPSHAASPFTDIRLRSAPTLSASTSTSASAKPPNPATPAPRDAPSFDITSKERLLHDIVDKALVEGVWTTRAWRLRRQELAEARLNT
ncbi:pyridoxal phosphate-dependent transferase [Lactarius vividus]|nr:pyridoxal phosphate-dependent transferase [Lactarius vividus]